MSEPPRQGVVCVVMIHLPCIQICWMLMLTPNPTHTPPHPYTHTPPSTLSPATTASYTHSYSSRELWQLIGWLLVQKPPRCPAHPPHPPYCRFLSAPRYSRELWQLIRWLLVQNPAARPTMDEIMDMEMVRAWFVAAADWCVVA